MYRINDSWRIKEMKKAATKITADPLQILDQIIRKLTRAGKESFAILK